MHSRLPQSGMEHPLYFVVSILVQTISLSELNLYSIKMQRLTTPTLILKEIMVMLQDLSRN